MEITASESSPSGSFNPARSSSSTTDMARQSSSSLSVSSVKWKSYKLPSLIENKFNFLFQFFQLIFLFYFDLSHRRIRLRKPILEYIKNKEYFRRFLNLILLDFVSLLVVVFGFGERNFFCKRKLREIRLSVSHNSREMHPWMREDSPIYDSDNF